MWKQAAARSVAGCLHWRDVAGPVYATIAILAELGWFTKDVGEWHAASGNKYFLRDIKDGVAGRIARHIACDAVNVQWSRAARHTFGAGLDESPPCF